MAKIKQALLEQDGSVTQSQVSALTWLAERGGSGVIDKVGRLVAQGECARQFADATWLRLFALGFLQGRTSALLPPRVYVSLGGREFLERIGYNG